MLSGWRREMTGLDICVAHVLRGCGTGTVAYISIVISGICIAVEPLFLSEGLTLSYNKRLCSEQSF
jgi:hypothetical protein